MSDEKDKPDSSEWRKSPKTGLWLPKGTPDGGKRPPVGFAAALERK